MSIKTEQVTYNPATGKIETASGYTLPFRVKDGIISFMDNYKPREKKRGGRLVYVSLEDIRQRMEGN